MGFSTVHYSLCLFWFFLTGVICSCSPGARIARNQPIDRSIQVGTAEFEKSIATIVNAPVIKGNEVKTLVNGDAFFSSMLEEIQRAKHSITFETYAFINGHAAYDFVNAFCDAAHRGVEVSVLLDAVGSIDIGEENINRLEKSGVSLTFYHPYSLRGLPRYNYRDHRKLMVVDGAVGFIGGCGVADAWKGNAHTAKHWRENHYRVRGPVVAQIQHSFADNWSRTGGQQLTGNHYFPPLKKQGSLKAQVFISSPVNKNYAFPHFYRQAIASAKKSIIIENSYFIPDAPVMREIHAARQRGVHVELLIPGNYTDSWPVRTLSCEYYNRLLKAGVHIYEYQPSMMHCKVMVIDGCFSSVGSGNFDPRSLYINDESNLNVFCSHFAEQQIKVIERDKKNSLRVNKAPSRWNPLRFPKRIIARALAPML